MTGENSITQWIADLKFGEEDVAQRALWNRYFQRLIGLARFKLGSAPRVARDEEDVAISALHSFFVGVEAGKFPALCDRTSLWPLLAKITARKAINQRKEMLRKKRGGGKVHGESCLLSADEASAWGFDALVADDLTPEHLAILDEQSRLLMQLLPEATLRTIAQKKLEGYSNAEIAQQMQVAERTIERKLHRIRNLWSTATE